MTNPFDQFLSLIFPKICAACGENAAPKHGVFCLDCESKLHATDHHLNLENEFTQRFYGLLPLFGGAAMYFFGKKGLIQHTVHQLKYRRQPEIGREIGRSFGRKLLLSEIFRQADLVIPVPLHPKKERLRGYNQSETFADGLAETMGIFCEKSVLKRTVFSDSQTKKSRQSRFSGIQSAFEIRNPKLLENKTVLLVDDVLTTGATLETCGKEILKIPGTRLLAATIAIAVN